MAKIDLKYAIWKEGKYFVARCLNVEVSSFGKTKNEAINNLEEALELYFKDEKDLEITKIEKVQIVTGSLEHA